MPQTLLVNTLPFNICAMELCELALPCTNICACKTKHFDLHEVGICVWGAQFSLQTFHLPAFIRLDRKNARTTIPLCIQQGSSYSAGHDICCLHFSLDPQPVLFVVYSITITCVQLPAQADLSNALIFLLVSGRISWSFQRQREKLFLPRNISSFLHEYSPKYIHYMVINYLLALLCLSSFPFGEISSQLPQSMPTVRLLPRSSLDHVTLHTTIMDFFSKVMRPSSIRNRFTLMEN